MTQKTWTKEEVRSRLETDVRFLFRGVKAIYARQTADEQLAKVTNQDNGVGFNGADAEYLSRIAERLNRDDTFNAREIERIRGKMLKYAGQLTRIANGQG